MNSFRNPAVQSEDETTKDTETKTAGQTEPAVSTASAGEGGESTTKDEDTIEKLANSLSADTADAEDDEDGSEKDEEETPTKQSKEAESRRSRRSVRPMARFTQNNPLYVYKNNNIVTVFGLKFHFCSPV